MAIKTIEIAHAMTQILAQTNDPSEINRFLSQWRSAIEGMDQESIHLLHESIIAALQKKVTRLYAVEMVGDNTFRFSDALREKLFTYIALTNTVVETSAETVVDPVDSDESTPASSIETLVALYEMTKTAAVSDEAGVLLPCLTKLAEAMKSPRNRSAAACCLRHIEDALCMQILEKGEELELYRLKGIEPWAELHNLLQSEDCWKDPKGYIQFFYYDLEQREFNWNEEECWLANAPF